MKQWEVYMDVHQLFRQGFKKTQIAHKLGISRTTVYKYLEKTPEEMSEWMASTQTRTKKLTPYHDRLLTWLKEHPDLSAAQIYDWLIEKEPALAVSQSTVRNYVRECRAFYQIPKAQTTRAYQAVPELPMGKQAQVDFGHTKQKTDAGKEIKMCFISFVLSHSRYKYVEWLDRPFTTKDVIRAHENAFQAFEGIPDELVYDQDALLVVSENAGDLILTKEFQAYQKERDLTLYVCRKADPESKGKIENVVKYVKNNFAKHRVFHNLEQWNEQCQLWLERTGNGKVHQTTKKRPVEVFALEKQHLRPVPSKINLLSIDSSITRTVRKDNTILYESNRYSVPLGTYGRQREVAINLTDEGELIIRTSQKGEVIGRHPICHERGQLIQDTQHKRDWTKGIEAYINHVAEHFTDHTLAHTFLGEVHKARRRYIRDQLQRIAQALEGLDQQTKDETLRECVKRKLHSAGEFRDVAQYVQRLRQEKINTLEGNSASAESLDEQHPPLIDAPEMRDVDAYVKLLKGESA